MPPSGPDQSAWPFAAELRAIVGEEGVLSKPEELLVYECDAYTLEKSRPNVVVLRISLAEVSGRAVER